MGLYGLILALACAGRQQMYEPIFAVAYDTTQVRFERASDAIRKACKLPVGMPWWIYARIKSDSNDYLVLSGLRRIEPDGPSDAPDPIEPDFGIVASIDRNACHRIHIDNGLAPQNSPTGATNRFKLSYRQREALAQDMLSRYRKAFGDSALVRSFDDSLLQDDFRPIEMRDAIRRFKAQLGTK